MKCTFIPFFLFLSTKREKCYNKGSFYSLVLFNEKSKQMTHLRKTHLPTPKIKIMNKSFFLSSIVPLCLYPDWLWLSSPRPWSTGLGIQEPNVNQSRINIRQQSDCHHLLQSVKAKEALLLRTPRVITGKRSSTHHWELYCIRRCLMPLQSLRNKFALIKYLSYWFNTIATQISFVYIRIFPLGFKQWEFEDVGESIYSQIWIESGACNGRRIRMCSFWILKKFRFPLNSSTMFNNLSMKVYAPGRSAFFVKLSLPTFCVSTPLPVN